MIALTIAGMRRDDLLDSIGRNCPPRFIPTVADLAECVETAIVLIGNPWVWVLAADLPRDKFARRLSAIGPIDLLVSDSVHAYCRSH